MGYSLELLKEGLSSRTTIREMKRDTRSIEYGSHGLREAGYRMLQTDRVPRTYGIEPCRKGDPRP